MLTIAKPDRLNPGDRIGIFVPASPVKNSFRQTGIKTVTALGLVPVEVDNILSKLNFVAKTPQDNFNDIQKLLFDNSIKALWAARGGYGSNLLLPLLPDLKINKPKILLGSSDISYMLWYFLDQIRTVVFYAPMIFSSVAKHSADLNNLMAVLTGDYSEINVEGKVLQHGAAKGIVTGGCLSNLVSLLGTKYSPVLENRILLLEDINERPYKLDRMLWQLGENNVFAQISGLFLGEFPGCFLTVEEKYEFLSRVSHYVAKPKIPVLYDLPFGHAKNAKTLPLGVEVTIDTREFTGFCLKEKGVK